MKRALFFIICIILSQSIQAKSFTAKCIAVKDGDTIFIEYKGQKRLVELQGIDCPELAQNCGEKAKAYVSDQIFDQQIDLDVSDVDSTGGLSAIVYLTYGKNLNQELVEKGLAWSRCKELAIMQKDARGNHLGIWSQTNPTPPWEFVRNPTVACQPTPKPTPVPINWEMVDRIKKQNEVSALEQIPKMRTEQARQKQESATKEMTDDYGDSYDSVSSDGSSGRSTNSGGRVYVRAYTKKDGTHVRSHTRSH